jgi:hypothetical protein
MSLARRSDVLSDYASSICRVSAGVWSTPKVMRTYTVQQLADLVRLTARTLHHYDRIGLLSPARDPANGYRRYGEDELLRLQQVMLVRELATATCTSEERTRLLS